MGRLRYAGDGVGLAEFTLLLYQGCVALTLNTTFLGPCTAYSSILTQNAPGSSILTNHLCFLEPCIYHVRNGPPVNSNLPIVSAAP